jgi:DNA repair exonuclease SbcCD nuclease subunit
MKDLLQIAFITDNHFGSTKLSPDAAYENFCDIVVPRLKDVDIIIHGGDLSDMAITMSQPWAMVFTQILVTLQTLVLENGIYLRVLHGTFTHDRRQPDLITVYNQFSNISEEDKHGVRYIEVINSLGLEHIKALGLKLAYIPGDETVEDPGDEIRELMGNVGWDKIDFLVHHGYCSHLVPVEHVAEKSAVLDPSKMDGCLDGLILNGHVHTPSFEHRVLNGGSFERVAHNEEEPKGFHIVTYNKKTHKTEVEFVVNTRTRPFVTINVAACENADAACRLVEQRLAKKDVVDAGPGPVHVSVRTDDLPLRRAVVEYLRSKHSNLIITSERVKRRKGGSKDTCLTSKTSLRRITPDNLPELAHEHIGDTLSLDDVKKVLSE